MCSLFNSTPNLLTELPRHDDFADVDFARLAVGRSLSFEAGNDEAGGEAVAAALDGAAEHDTDPLAVLRQRFEALETEMRSSMEVLRAEVAELKAQLELFGPGAVLP